MVKLTIVRTIVRFVPGLGTIWRQEVKAGSMVKFDTIKLKVNTDMVEGIKGAAFDTVERKTANNAVLSKKLVLNGAYRCLGLKNIELYGGLSTGTIELSAKILKEDYYDLINRNTIEQVIDALNGLKIIEFNRAKFLDRAEVLRADVTENLIVSREPAEYITFLQIFPINHKYRVEKYMSEAVVFKRNVLSYKERMIFYDKHSEMLKDREVKFLGIEKFKNVLRCEQNITSFDRLRKLFNLEGGAILLKDLLDSEAQVNYETFERITENYNNQILSELLSGEVLNLRLREVEKEYGQRSIIKAFNYDLNKVFAFIKLYYKNRIKTYQKFREYKKVFEAMKTERIEKEVEVIEAIKEIKELLRVA